MDNFNRLDNSPYVNAEFPIEGEEHLFRSSLFKDSKLIARLLEESQDNRIVINDIESSVFSALMDYKIGIEPSDEQLPHLITAAEKLECRKTVKKLRGLAEKRFILPAQMEPDPLKA